MMAGTRGDHILLGRMLACVEMIGRCGAREVEIAHMEDCGEPEPLLWHVTAMFKGTKVWSRHYPYPAQAAEDLLSKLMNGGQCKRCGNTTMIGVDVPGLCCFQLTAANVDDEQTYHYLRTCEV